VINCVLAGMLVAVLAWAVLRLTNCRNAGTRFAVWFSALVAIAGLSLITLAIGGSGNGAGVRIPHLTLPASWLWYAFLIWAAVAGFGMLRIGVSLTQIWLLRRRSRELAETEIDPQLRRTLDDFHALRRVKVCVSDELRVPAAVGITSPAVIIPRWALEELSSCELNAVLLHELGHLGRWDDWTNLAQKIVRAVLFFHPAVWWIDSHLALEREMACDDLVLARTSDARGYAQCLVSVAEKSLLRSGMALALAAVSRMRQTTARLVRILDPNRLNETRVSKPVLAGVTVAGLMVLIALPHAPTLVEFKNATPVMSAGELSVPASPIHQTSFKLDSAIPQPVDTAARSARPHVVNAVLRSSTPADRKTRNQARALRTHVSAVRPSTPRVLQVSMKGQESASPIVFLVVQTQEFERSGLQAWNVRVWRLTVTVTQKELQAQNGTIARSI
jgi:hypothetical protein